MTMNPHTSHVPARTAGLGPYAMLLRLVGAHGKGKRTPHQQPGTADTSAIPVPVSSTVTLSAPEQMLKAGLVEAMRHRRQDEVQAFLREPAANLANGLNIVGEHGGFRSSLDRVRNSIDKEKMELRTAVIAQAQRDLTELRPPEIGLSLPDDF